jgi:phospholipid-binding lipoprotein MlaA
MKNIVGLFKLLLILLLSLEAGAIPSYPEIYVYDNQDPTLLDAPTDPAAEPLISDPLEPVNRHIFNINSLIDTAFVAPVIETYLAVTPKHLRSNIGNFVNNLGEPINFINLMLQGNFSQARVTFGRFITNTVLGFLGFVDVASKCNLAYKGEDFGQTLAHYGVSSGIYIVVPIFGPSSVRDSSGRVFDFFADPIRYTLTREERDVVNIAWLVDKRADANQIIKTVKKSLDPYETAKALYIQNRMNQIKQ